MNAKVFGVVVAIAVCCFLLASAGVGFVIYAQRNQEARMLAEKAQTEAVLHTRMQALAETEQQRDSLMESERKLKDERNLLAAELAEAKQTIARLEAKLKAQE